MSEPVTPASDHWLAIRVQPSGDAQVVINALFAAGSLGVQESGASIVTHFPPGTDASEIEALVRQADPQASITCEPTPAVDWSEWRASVGEHRLGRITIAPPWMADGTDSMRVLIEPAMAFGTGEHPTTRGVVRLMQQLPRMAETVADLGAGSAVLAICAAKLGARTVTAIELDADAIGNAEENVATNGVAESVTVIQGDATLLLPLVAPVGLVLANIISSVLTGMLPVIRESLSAGGHAILSGILTDERDSMLGEIRSGGWKVVAEDVEDVWWSVLIQ